MSEQIETPPGASLTLGASAPQNGPQDHFAGQRPDGADPIESQLQALIAECHRIIRDVVVPSAEQARTVDDRLRCLDTVTQLVRDAAMVGDTVARLRGGFTEERRQRIVVERIERTGLPWIEIPEDAPAPPPAKPVSRRRYPQVDKTGGGGV